VKPGIVLTHRNQNKKSKAAFICQYKHMWNKKLVVSLCCIFIFCKIAEAQSLQGKVIFIT